MSLTEKKRRVSLTEHTEITERREKGKNVVGFFYKKKNPTTVLLCELQSTHVNRREPDKWGRKIFAFREKLPANSPFSACPAEAMRRGMNSVDSSESTSG